MKTLATIIGFAGLVGLGYYVGKKLIEKKVEDASEIAKEQECECCGCGNNDNMLHRASMFAVGALKTNADKVCEGVREIMTTDMVKKGEDTVKKAKEATNNIKQELSGLNFTFNVSTSKNSPEDTTASVEAPSTLDDDGNEAMKSVMDVLNGLEDEDEVPAKTPEDDLFSSLDDSTDVNDLESYDVIDKEI